MNFSLTKIFILALIIRLIIAPFFYHPDLKSQNFHFQFLAHKEWNIYQFIATNKTKLPYRDTFNYLPLTYFSLGTLQAITAPLAPVTLLKWLNDWGPEQNNYIELPIFLLLLKIPYIIFDLAIAFLIFKMYGQRTMMLWLYNPLNLYLIYILGNFDVITTFFAIFSLYLIRKNHLYSGLFALGISTALKIYPILFVPFFLLTAKRINLKILILSIISFSIPLLITIAPFFHNTYFLASLTGSGLTQKIFQIKIGILPLFPIFYIVIFLLFLKKKNLEHSLLLVFIAFLVFVDFHSQWLIWFLPFILPEIISTKLKIVLFSIISLLAISYVFITNDNFLFWGHLIPLDKDFIYLRSPYQLLKYRFHLTPEILQIQIKYLIGLVSALLLISKHEHT